MCLLPDNVNILNSRIRNLRRKSAGYIGKNASTLRRCSKLNPQNTNIGAHFRTKMVEMARWVRALKKCFSPCYCHERRYGAS
jgi:hypothetical protein